MAFTVYYQDDTMWVICYALTSETLTKFQSMPGCVTPQTTSRWYQRKITDRTQTAKTQKHQKNIRTSLIVHLYNLCIRTVCGYVITSPSRTIRN